MNPHSIAQQMSLSETFRVRGALRFAADGDGDGPIGEEGSVCSKLGHSVRVVHAKAAIAPPPAAEAPVCALAWIRFVAVLLLLLCVVCTQGAASAEDHHHSAQHCCAICHAGTLPFLQPVTSALVAPALPAVWFEPAAKLNASYASLVLTGESRAPPAS
ncbi:MAG: hypothetical protein JST11_10115 [Acidobacteria bacterium]|nr:hypothetical protein [Acidobacteriota bacterium]